jgi:hypothetical protein
MPGYSVDWKKKDNKKVGSNTVSKSDKVTQKICNVTNSKPAIGTISGFTSSGATMVKKEVCKTKKAFLGKLAGNISEHRNLKSPIYLVKYGDTLKQQANNSPSAKLKSSRITLNGLFSTIAGFLGLVLSILIVSVKDMHTPVLAVFYGVSLMAAVVFATITIIKAIKRGNENYLNAGATVAFIGGILLSILGIVLAYASLILIY